VDNSGNEIVRFGKYGNFDDGRSAAATAAGKPKSEIPLAYPTAAKSSFKYIYVADSANRRVVRVDPVYALEASCSIE
jgi:hypothetical protein